MSRKGSRKVLRPAQLLERLAIVAALVVLGLVITACGGSDGSGGKQETDDLSGEVVVADFGGTTRDYRAQAFFRPFEEETGVKVVSADADVSKIPLFAENRRAEWDLVDLGGRDVMRFADHDMLAELPPEVPRVGLVPEDYKDYATSGYTISIGVGYSTKDGAREPRTWADFFDTDRFPGKRGLPTFPYFQVEGALLADGVACEDLFPLDFDRAFAKLDEIRDDVIVWDSFGQASQFLAQGSASMVITANGRIAALQQQDLPAGFLWDGAFFNAWAVLAVPRDAPNADAAFALLDFMSRPEPQAEFARSSYYGPTNPDALDLLDQRTLEKLPNSYMDVQCPMDHAGLAKQIEEYTKRYSEWLARL